MALLCRRRPTDVRDLAKEAPGFFDSQPHPGNHIRCGQWRQENAHRVRVVIGGGPAHSIPGFGHAYSYQQTPSLPMDQSPLRRLRLARKASGIGLKRVQIKWLGTSQQACQPALRISAIVITQIAPS